jgi:hypothetical protein
VAPPAAESADRLPASAEVVAVTVAAAACDAAVACPLTAALDVAVTVAPFAVASPPATLLPRKMRASGIAYLVKS